MVGWKTLNVQTYKVRDAYTGEELLQTNEFDEAVECAEEWRHKRSHNLIELVAVVDV